MRYLYPCKPNRLSHTSRFFDELDRDVNWIAEVKKNGWRCLPEKNEGLTLWTRHKTAINEPLEALREALICLPDATVLDGELLHFRGGRKGTLYLFDILMVRGELLVDLSLSERRGILEIIIKDYIGFCPFIELAGQARLGKKQLYRQSIMGKENEGIVLKKLDSRYPVSDRQCRQNPFWLKVKKVDEHLITKGDNK